MCSNQNFGCNITHFAKQLRQFDYQVTEDQNPRADASAVHTQVSRHTFLRFGRARPRIKKRARVVTWQNWFASIFARRQLICTNLSSSPVPTGSRPNGRNTKRKSNDYPVKLYSETAKFRKVVRQQIWGYVADYNSSLFHSSTCDSQRNIEIDQRLPKFIRKRLRGRFILTHGVQ